ncbi:hypothetical protein [Streptomyces fractus]|uniref:hypothetical protein n=1 Tax=Streptomyces fractus TaxID=641806 RepID=UPI003CF80315
MTAHSPPPVEPGDEADGAGRAVDRSSVGALLGDAVRGATPPPGAAEGERRALAAYRAARASGALTAAPRRRDDWRPGGP